MKKFSITTSALVLLSLITLIPFNAAYSQGGFSKKARPLNYSRIAELQKSVADLENELLDLKVQKSSRVGISAFDAMKFDFGGFISQTWTLNHGGDFSSENSFDQTNVELLLSADITEKDRFFSALGYLRQHDFENEHTLEDVDLREFGGNNNRNPAIIAWWRHAFSDTFDVKAGRFITPWGIINVEHFPPTLMELNQPNFLRPFPGNTIVPNFLNGLEAHKSIPTANLDINAYVGNFSGYTGEAITGARLVWSPLGEEVKIGASYQNGVKQFSSSDELGGETDDRYNAFGVDLFLDYDRYGLKAEWLTSTFDDEGDEEAFYAQPFIRAGDFVFFYRYDFIDLAGNVDAARDEVEHIIGANYFVDENVRLRLQYTVNMYEVDTDFDGEDRDFNQLQASVTASF